MNYSKWDKFEVSSDEEEERGLCDVTDLGGPTSVQINGPNIKFLKKPTQAEAPVIKAKTQACNESSSKVQEGDDFVRREAYKWCQSRDDVTIVIPLAVGLRSKDLQVSLRGADKDDNSAAAPSKPILTIRATTGTGLLTTLLQGALQYPIVPQDMSECWEVLTVGGSSSGSSGSSGSSSDRQIELTLRKQSPIPGAVQWWTRVLEAEPPIDPTTVPARLRMQSQQVPRKAAEEGAGGQENEKEKEKEQKEKQQQSFQDVWQQAHAMFRSQVKNKENMHAVDLSDAGHGQGQERGQGQRQPYSNTDASEIEEEE